jgi:signal transduction histidine kinase
MIPRAEETGRHADRPRPSRGFVKTAFMVMGAGAMVATLFAVVQTQRLQTNARGIVENMLTSVRLVSQLQSAVEKRRILIDDHIFATKRDVMASIEGELDTLDKHIDTTMHAYDPWASLPGERASWNRSRAELEALNAPVGRALTLSRENRDVEARTVMNGIASQFALVDQDFDQLISINDTAANESLRNFSMIRLWLELTLLGIGLAALAATLGVGRWTMRHVTFREDEMTRDAEQLQAKNRELDAFAGRVAHDIRGTLTTITLAMMPLSQKVPSDDRAMAILRRGTKQMETLVDDLLALARVETLAHGQCDPAAVVAQVAQDVGPRVEAEHGALRVSVGHADVACSEGLLRQAVTNLIENALKYHRTAVAPAVEISGAKVPGGYDLRVSDNGMGMSKDEADHASEPFYRSPRMRDRPGTGLGLSIVSRVAEASGGTLSIDSQLGQGSTFVVHLPLAAPVRADGARGG